MQASLAFPNIRAQRISVSAFFFIAGLTFASWASRIPDIKNSLQLNEARLGSILFALPVGLMASLPLSGFLVSKYGSRKMVIVGALLYPFMLLFLGLASSVLQLVASLFLFGLFSNLVNIAMNTQAVGVEAGYGRSIMASFHGLWSIAGFTGAAIGTFLVMQGVSPFLHFLLIFILTGIILLMAFRFLPAKEETVNNGSSRLFVKPDQQILILGLIAFCCMFCEGAMADWSGVYFQKVIHAPARFTTVGYLAFTATMATGRFLSDSFQTKYGVKFTLRVSGLLIVAGLLLAILLPYMLTATLGLFMVGFGVSSVVPLVYGVAGKSSTMSAGLALAAVSTISFLGFLIGPPLIGFIAQAAGLRLSFAVVALLGLGTAVLAGKIRKV